MIILMAPKCTNTNKYVNTLIWFCMHVIVDQAQNASLYDK